MCGLLPLCAQSPRRAKHGKSMREKVARADSLRLELRKAADEGRMLQWSDSLLRDRFQRGDIDSARYARLLARAKRVDSHLHRGDQLLAKKYKKITFDTLYITRPEGRWTIKLRTKLSGAQMKYNGYQDQVPFSGNLRTDGRATLSVSAAYRGIAIALAINPAKLAGKNKDNELNITSYSNKYGFDISYMSSKTYHGTLERNGISADLSRSHIKQQALNVNLYYVFNNKRFSFPAAFSQSYVQRRSAGSFMLGMSLEGQRTTTDDVPSSAGPRSARMRIYSLAIGAGYGYNLVVGRHWLFHLSALPTFDVFLRSHLSTDEGKVRLHYHFPSAIITGRGAAVYSWRNKFAGVTSVFNFSNVGNASRLEIQRAKEVVRVFYGFRF